MLIHKKRKALILKPRDPNRITSVIPTAKTFEWKGTTLVAVPHKVEEVRVLRNLGIDAPSPILHYYEWPGRFKPFEAQLYTAAFFTYYNRAFCLNGLGSGKTQATLWAYDFLRSQGAVKRMLVVSPLSTLERAWGDSVFDHFPHLTFCVLYGSKDRRLKLLAQPADIYIVNHDGLKVIAEALKDRDDIDLVVVDEIAQAARNAQTDRWKVLNTVVNKHKPPRRCWGLTGTPTPNEPTDAWAQCRLVAPDTVPPYFNRFKDMTMRQTGPFRWVARENATEIVHRAMQPAIRFSREECVDLPPTTFATREVKLTPEQAKAYKEMHEKLMAEVDSGQVLAVNEAVKAGKLVQIACGVVYDSDGNEVALPNHPRVDVVADIVEEAETKTIVFVPFVSSVNMVAEELTKRGFSTAVIYGEVPKAERDMIFSSFQKLPEPRVIVAQPAAMAHGLTLTAANTIVWYAPVNSAEIYEQANGRCARPGQKHNTFIIHIEGTPLERKMYQRLQHKQKMQGLLLDMVVDTRGELVT